MKDTIGTVSKENIWHFTCAFCSGTWSVGTMDEWQPGELYCTHCGKPQINQEINTPKHFSKTVSSYQIGSEEAIEPSVSDTESSITIVPKTKERLYAEDRMTHQECGNDGWWNPILKKCEGTGRGHNVTEFDEPDY